ncbi:MAG: BamA/TamA family outer membrane protein [Gemmatimonadota bacterium]|nr:MAG: BamA/TamA family outer membrane protein [Gemmatimonadota bacterium]
MASARRCAPVLALLVLLPTAALAQDPKPVPDSAIVVPGARYAVSGLRQFFWGKRYRGAWTTPAKLEVLDLDSFAGNLEPVRKLSGRQTHFLILRGADGKSYAFRSVDKDPTSVLPAAWRGTIAEDILQDQISSQHPAAALVVDKLEEAATVLHPTPHLFVRPDDQALGEYRQEFAGMLGLLVEGCGYQFADSAIFAGASRIIGTDELLESLLASPANRVDARAFLTARLVDILVGDWDRHRGQWRWARFGSSSWKPIPEDRDQAFSGLDGLIPAQAWRFLPELVAFKEKYPNIIGLHFTAQEVDRRFLVDLELQVWDSIASSLVERLGDDLIEEAVGRLPPEMNAIDGPRLTRTLQSRRDALPEVARRFYRLLAREVEIHATDVDDELRIEEIAGGLVEVTLSDRNDPAEPYYRRRFNPAETRDIRIKLHGGDDRAVVRGTDKLGTTVRIVGGDGDDELFYETSTGGVRFYDQSGSNRVSGRHGGRTGIDERPYKEWSATPDNERPPRDWGGSSFPILVVGASSDYGFYAGVGQTRFSYGFRQHPYALRLSLAAGIATTGKVAARFDLDYRLENSLNHLTLATFYSELDLINFYGFGNNAAEPAGGIGESAARNVDRGMFVLEPAIARSFGGNTDLSLGLTLRFSNTSEDSAKLVNQLPGLIGTGDFWQLGGFVGLILDSRDVTSAATKGATLSLRGSYYPELLDNKSTFGALDAVATTYLSAGLPLDPTLALRAGGRKVWGGFPYFEAAFLGGVASLRGWETERFAGDASLFGNAELRLLLARPRMPLLQELGVFGLADIGRVYVDGESPGDWHTGFGGGLWLAFLGRQNSVSASVARSSEGTTFYINYGLPF